jgi:chemotaxis family two-component system sensor kinase Cph1
VLPRQRHPGAGARALRHQLDAADPDATYRPVPLEPVLTPHTGRPLDLSGAMLRSVSPVHLEYLANMGVVASMSISLIDRGRL